MEKSNNKIKAVVVDDEASGVENLCMLLGEFCPIVEVVGSAATIPEALNLIVHAQPQLAFLDVQMGTRSIFELLTQLPDLNFEVVFVTAHEQFAIKAFRFMAVDYLLKPLEITDLIQAVEKARQNLERKQAHGRLEQLLLNLKTPHTEQHKIAFSATHGYELAFVQDIMYFIADGSYTEVFFKDKHQLTVSKNLKFYEEITTEYGFIRVHNSCLINPKYIRSIERTDGGGITMDDGRSLPISKKERQKLEDIIKQQRRLIL